MPTTPTDPSAVFFFYFTASLFPTFRGRRRHGTERCREVGLFWRFCCAVDCTRARAHHQEPNAFCCECATTAPPPKERKTPWMGGL
jgi:hypothetical protein